MRKALGGLLLLAALAVGLSACASEPRDVAVMEEDWQIVQLLRRLEGQDYAGYFLMRVGDRTATMYFMSSRSEDFGTGSMTADEDGDLELLELRVDSEFMLTHEEGIADFETVLNIALTAFDVSEATQETVLSQMVYYSDVQMMRTLYADGAEIKSCIYPDGSVMELVLTIAPYEGAVSQEEGIVEIVPAS